MRYQYSSHVKCIGQCADDHVVQHAGFLAVRRDGKRFLQAKMDDIEVKQPVRDLSNTWAAEQQLGLGV
jgi:hypothetical protein